MPKNYAVKAANHVNWAKHVDVLKYVEAQAAMLKSQRSIAAALGKPFRTFESAMGAEKGENPLRLAFEAGKAKAEQEQIDEWRKTKPTDAKTMVAWIFGMKAQFGWRDKPEAAGNDAPRINFILPGSMTEADYYKSLGITGPIDTRTGTEKNALGDAQAANMKDVTPGADGKMPSKPELGTSHKLIPAQPITAAPMDVIKERVRALTTPPGAPFVPNVGQKNPGPNS